MRAAPTRRSAIAAASVTLILLGAALAVALALDSYERAHARDRDRARTELVTDVLAAELERAEAALRAGGAFLSEQEVATADEFDRFFRAMPLPESVTRVAWAPAVANPQLAAFAGTAGIGMTTLTSESAGTLVASHPWLSVPMLYVTPDPGPSRRTRGVDISTDPVRRRVLAAVVGPAKRGSPRR